MFYNMMRSDNFSYRNFLKLLNTLLNKKQAKQITVWRAGPGASTFFFCTMKFTEPWGSYRKKDHLMESYLGTQKVQSDIVWVVYIGLPSTRSYNFVLF